MLLLDGEPFSVPIDVVIIGAGPYGLSVAAHLRASDVSCRIFGKPLATWRDHMPAGMMLKSDGFASNLSDPRREGTLEAYCRAHGVPYGATDHAISLALFNEYALDFQRRFVPELEELDVVALDRDTEGFSIRLENGEILQARQVVVAVGIAHFAHMPPELAGLPRHLVSHSADHHDVSSFAGREICVIGGGSSAVDLATLLAEAGTRVQLIARSHQVRFANPAGVGRRSLWKRIRHPSSGIGPGLRSRLFEVFPGLFRFLPGPLRLFIIKRHLGPKAAWGMKARFEAGVDALVGGSVVTAAADGARARLGVRDCDGTMREVLADQVIAATGYAVYVERIKLIDPGLRGNVRTHRGMPLLSGNFESSVPGLYFVGPAAVNSFGPLMRFMVGAKYVAPRIAQVLAKRGTVSLSPVEVATA